MFPPPSLDSIHVIRYGHVVYLYMAELPWMVFRRFAFDNHNDQLSYALKVAGRLLKRTA